MATSKTTALSPLATFMWKDTAATTTLVTVTGATSGSLLQADIDNQVGSVAIFLKMVFPSGGTPSPGSTPADIQFYAPAGKRIIYSIPQGIPLTWINGSGQLYYWASTSNSEASSAAPTSGEEPTVRITMTS
jgi:hypothetical protein